jgi:hypothetical protein
MSANPYLTPKSDLANDRNSESDFYIVSTVKLVVLFIATMGGYRLYWYYKNWALYKASAGLSLWPVPRSLFDVFFVYSLFSIINRRIIESGRNYPWRPGLRAVALIVLTVFGMVQDRFFSIDVNLGVAVILLAVNAHLFVGAQRAINFLANDLEGQTNAQFTMLNYFWILVGLGMWGLTYWSVTNLMLQLE